MSDLRFRAHPGSPEDRAILAELEATLRARAAERARALAAVLPRVLACYHVPAAMLDVLEPDEALLLVCMAERAGVPVVPDLPVSALQLDMLDTLSGKVAGLLLSEVAAEVGRPVRSVGTPMRDMLRTGLVTTVERRWFASDLGVAFVDRHGALFRVRP